MTLGSDEEILILRMLFTREITASNEGGMLQSKKAKCNKALKPDGIYLSVFEENKV